MALDAARSRLYHWYSRDRLQLRAIRQELGLTQAGLAEAIGVRPNTVARWERGEIGISEPTARLVEKIAAERKAPSERR